MSRFISNKLEHLSDDQIDELLKKYYQKASISKLIKEYHLNVTSHKFASILPLEIKPTDSVCEYCGGKLLLKHLSRCLSPNHKYVCVNCNHSLNDDDCVCKFCEEKRQQLIQEEEEKKALKEYRIKEYLRSRLEVKEEYHVDFDELTFIQKVYLGALLRGGIYEDYSCIKSIISLTTPLAPTYKFVEDIISELTKKSIIVIHPNTDIDCFSDIDIENDHFCYQVYKVLWYLNVKSSHLERIPLIDSIINPDFEFDKDEALKLWRNIALNECTEYLIYNIRRVFNIEFSVGEKTISVINDLLKYYSVSQIYYIIYNSTSKALRYKEEYNVSKNHAANTIIGNMQSLGERALNKGWVLEKYSRNRDCPQSLISKFFFERILRIDEGGFNLKPDL